MDCVIFGAAPGGVSVRNLPDGAFCIAADAGLTLAARLGVTPDLVIGDFDSLGTVPVTPHMVRLPVRKDCTDTQAAVEAGLAHGCDRFLLLGCTGGRPDHTYANYQLLLSLARDGREGYLIGDGYTVTAVRCGALHFPVGMRGTVSVFAAGGTARGVTEEGLDYTVTDATLTPDTPIGVSNAFLDGRAGVIRVRDGALLVFWEGEDLRFPLTTREKATTIDTTEQN